MKIGILTYHNIPNIGATLQAYALWKVLNSIGLRAEIIDYKCENIIKRELTFHPRKNFLKTFFLHKFIWPHTQRRIQGCLSFMQAQHCFSNVSYTKENISEANKKYDGFISGSDMIWHRDINGYDDTFFLSFVQPNKKKYSYASSIGDIWKESELPHIKDLLSKYDFRSAREEDTASFITQNLNLPTQWVADPTMLLNSQHWQEFTQEVPYKNYVLVYFPYTDILNAARCYARQHNKRLLVINNGLHIFGEKNIRINNPQQWLSYICYADAVFTDSYHGLLFSLYFERPVWTHNTSNRLQSILKRFNIEYRFIPKDEQLKSFLDYSELKPLLSNFRKESMQFLYKIAKDFAGNTLCLSKESKNSTNCS